MTTFTQRLRESERTSRARRLSQGSRSVLLRASSLRSLPRTQPPCTNVSLPSGRISDTVACRSTSGRDERTQRRTDPAPITVVFAGRPRVAYETAVPEGRLAHL